MIDANRENRLRMAGLIQARLLDAKLDEVADPRDSRGRKWELPVILNTIVVGVMAGAKSLANVENLTAEMSRAMARKLGIFGKKLPDTTMRDTVCRLDPDELRKSIHAEIRAAQRRKSLEPTKFPFGVLAVDGKGTSLPSWDPEYSQHSSETDRTSEHGLLRTMTCALISGEATVCIDVIPIHASTNEMGQFKFSFESLMQTYGRLNLFRMISYDSGACSLENASLMHAEKIDYLLALDALQPTLLAKAKLLLGELGPEKAVAETIDDAGANTVIRRAYITEEMAGFHGWWHLKTVVRIESETLNPNGVRVHYDNRYRLSSLSRSGLTDKQWLALVRAHWGVENHCHHTFDKTLEEDNHPWITHSPQGMLAILLLRRIAYNMLALFRSVTCRSEEKRATPWADILRRMYNALIAMTQDDLRGLRPRVAAPTV